MEGALPCHSDLTFVEDAIARAADSIKSLAASIASATKDERNKACIEDRGPSNGDIPDAVLGVGIRPPPACGGYGKEEAAEKQGAKEVTFVGEGEEPAAADRVLVLGEDDEGLSAAGEEKKACPVDALEGTDEKDMEKKNRIEWEVADVNNDDDRPRLVVTRDGMNKPSKALYDRVLHQRNVLRLGLESWISDLFPVDMIKKTRNLH